MQLKITCLQPEEMMTSSAVQSMPFSRWNLAATARRSAGVPATSVYFVSPASMARIAASLMLRGVSKSGSPAASPITSRPAALRARALPATPIVWLGLMRFRRAAMRLMAVPVIPGATGSGGP